MNPMTLKLGMVYFPYGGNGGTSSEVPDVRNWTVETVLQASKDERISEIHHAEFSDTPITMTRNRAIQWAHQKGIDVLVMVDSDMQPDCELGRDPSAKPFWSTSFDYLYENFQRGPHVIAAPYCGPPPPMGTENVYVFQWRNYETGNPHALPQLKAYEREEAVALSGIQPAAALPTGLIMYDMRIFDILEPPYFYYEYPDDYQAEKCSTEDVTATRDMSFHGLLEYGYNPVLCNWDAWAGHWKPKLVGKPRFIHTDQVNDKFQRAVMRNRQSNEKMVMVGGADEQRLASADSKPHFLSAFTPKSNGQDIIRIGGIQTPPQDLEKLREVVAWYRYRDPMSYTEFEETVVIEVGCWVGESTLAIWEAVKPDGKIYCVDTFEGTPGDETSVAAERAGGPKEVHQSFFKNVQHIPFGQIECINWDSTKVAENFNCGGADIIFIDADHSYDAVRADILAWLPHLKDGGLMIFHDYDWGDGNPSSFSGVRRAVNEIFGEHNVHQPDQSKHETIAWVRVTKELRDGIEEAEPRGDNEEVSGPNAQEREERAARAGGGL